MAYNKHLSEKRVGYGEDKRWMITSRERVYSEYFV
jgi:hypothetical protein